MKLHQQKCKVKFSLTFQNQSYVSTVYTEILYLKVFACTAGHQS